MIDPTLIAHLTINQVSFCVIGAAGLAAHGFARYSADIDLLTMDRRVLARELWPADISIEINLGDAEDPLAGVVRWPAMTPHDLIVGRGEAMRFAVETCEHNTTLACPVVTPTALLLLKLEAGGIQDLYDIEGLVGASKIIDGAPWLLGIDSHARLLSPRARRLWSEVRERLLT